MLLTVLGFVLQVLQSCLSDAVQETALPGYPHVDPTSATVVKRLANGVEGASVNLSLQTNDDLKG